MKKLAAGNWKMHGTTAALDEARTLARAHADPGCEVLLCPPATLVAAMAEAVRGSTIEVGGQDCHAAPSGAHTGDIAAEMLADAGASHVILGHSERRADHGETDEVVAAKVESAWRAGLRAIICVGETGEEREAGKALAVVDGELAGSIPDGATSANTIIAYEPIWAIGTGRIPTPQEISDVHGHIRKTLSARFGADGAAMRILYGGSVKPSNAATVFAARDVDGALVGGASLKAADFGPIIEALAAAG